MNPRDDNWRKAAILVATLEPDDASAIWQSLSPAEATQLRQAKDELHDVDPLEQQAVIAEFLGRRAPVLVDATGGVELDDNLARRLAGIDGFDRGPTVVVDTRDAWSTGELAEAEPEAIQRCLSDEGPQLVAAVLSQLSPARAAAVLEHWPTDQHAELLRRVGEMGPISPELLCELQQTLVVRLRSDALNSAAARNALASVRAILEAADEPFRQAWQVDPPSAEVSGEPRELPVVAEVSAEEEVGEEDAVAAPLNSGRPATTWNELCNLDDESLVAVLAAGPPESVRLAVAGADPEIVQRIRRYLGGRAARRLDQQLSRLVSVRIRDIVAAQRHLGELAGRMAAAGTIRLAAPQESRR